jgi:hypothetical protein
MENTATSLPTQRFFKRFMVFNGAVSAGHNPLWIFIPVTLVVAYLVLPPLCFIL